jgi:hypothetical protein
MRSERSPRPCFLRRWPIASHVEVEAKNGVEREWSLAPSPSQLVRSRTGRATEGIGFRISTVGVILMIVGGAGFVTSTIFSRLVPTSGRQHHHSYDRQVFDPQGRSSEVHEEVH